MLQSKIDENFDWNEAFPTLNGDTLLLHTIKLRRADIVKELLENGCPALQYFPKKGKNSLHFAAMFPNVEILECLIAKLDDPGAINEPETKKSKTVLHFLVEAASSENSMEAKAALEMLLEKKIVDLNVHDVNLETPLVLAIQAGLDWLVLMLLKAGANLDLPTPYGKTCRDMLFEQKSTIPLEKLDMVDHGTTISSSELTRMLLLGDLSSFHEQMSNTNWPNETWNFTVNYGSETVTMLQYCTLNSFYDTIQRLLAKQADPNLTGSNLDPPCFIAAQLKQPTVLEILREDGRTNFNAVVQKDVNVGNHVTNRQYNVLHALLNTDYTPWYQNNAVNWTVIQKTSLCLSILTPLLSYETLNSPETGSLSTPLHLATRWPSQGITRQLLQTHAERSLLVLNSEGYPPIARMLTSTLREYFDSKIVFENAPTEKRFKISIDHDILLPYKKMDQSTENRQKETNYCYTGQQGVLVETPATEVPELEHLIRIGQNHKDLMDHPLVSSMIWLKWNHFKKVNKLVSVILGLKLMLHVSLISFVLAHFGGRSALRFDCSNSTQSFQFNCNPDWLLITTRTMLLLFWSISILQLLISSVLRIQKKGTLENLAYLASPLEFKIILMILILVPWIALESPLKVDRFGFGFEACRDVGGFLVVMAGCDVCFIIRDHLGDRQVS